MVEIVTSGRKRGRSETEGNSVQCAQSTDEGENHDVGKGKKLVEWNSKGQPVGAVSVKFSSTMGVIVREQVPIVIDNWHGVKDLARDSLWTLLMQKYMVDVCFKPFILQQMGKLWRSWKSELSTEIRKILELKSTKTERTNLIAKLKPHDVSLPEWDQFVHIHVGKKFENERNKSKTDSYPHIESKRNKEHPDKPLTKPQLWIEAHVSKKKTSEANAAKIAEVQKKIDEATDDGEDILTQVLGPERPGRIRGVGAGVTKTKLYAQAQSDAKIEKLEAKLQVMTTKYKKIEAAFASKLGISLEDDDESGEVAPTISKIAHYAQ
uniref:uncharacterized protein LOC105351934 n=1 Tax=Fragaria vesca subsp. vesca TaxID=101020 RepID=UPI0005CA8DC2|nr:PREDICTED: uncharacterized protein LOC105351934 [Fragaria vesca subsp. vesca]